MSITYKKAGVHIDKAESFIRRINTYMPQKKKSYSKAFGSVFELASLLRGYKKPLLVSSADGVGTKLKVAQQCGIHTGVGIDLVAMNVNDLVCLGARPLFFLDYIACGSLEVDTLTQVVSGIKRGLDQAACILLGGETAEMPGMYRRGEYDLAGFAVGIVDKKKIVTGQKIKKGDVVIGLYSSGLHSNGYSLVRRVLSPAQIQKYKKTLLCPTRIYVKPVLRLLDRFNREQHIITGIAHVTGGAFYTKITKILPDDCAFRIDTSTWRKPLIFGLIQGKGRVSQEEMFSTFNMGIGMVIVVKRSYADKVVAACRTMKYRAVVIGDIIRQRREKTVFV